MLDKNAKNRIGKADRSVFSQIKSGVGILAFENGYDFNHIIFNAVIDAIHTTYATAITFTDKFAASLP